MISIQFDVSPALGRLLDQPAALVRRAGTLAAKRAAEDYVGEVRAWIGAGRAFTPRTGRLEQFIGWHAQGDGAVVYANSPYAGYIETGTRPHIIRPKPGRTALRFFMGGPGGGQMIRRAVQHPGTAPMPFFFAELPRRQGVMLAAAREAVAEVLLG